MNDVARRRRSAGRRILVLAGAIALAALVRRTLDGPVASEPGASERGDREPGAPGPGASALRRPPRRRHGRAHAAPLAGAAALVAALVFLGGPSAPHATVDWNSGFEQTWAPWQGLQHDQNMPLSDSFRYVSPGRTGSFAAQFLAKQGYGPAWGTEGSNLCCGPSSEGVPGTDEYWAFSDLFPTDWVAPYHWGITFQFHAGNDMPPAIAFDVGADAMWLDIRTGAIDPSAVGWAYGNYPKILSTLSKGHWNDYVIHVHWAGDNSGVIELWHRVPDQSLAWTKALTLTGIPTLQVRNGTPDHIYVDDGIYRDSYCPQSVLPAPGCTSSLGTQPDSVYTQDDLVRGASFDEVVSAAWSGAASPSPATPPTTTATTAATNTTPAAAASAPLPTTGTIGNTATGDFTDGGGSNYLDASGPYTLPAAASVSKLTGRIAGESSAVSVRGVVYADAGGKPGGIVGTTSQVTIAAGSSAAWVDLPFPSAIALPAGEYWLGYWYGPGAGSGGGGFAFTTAGGSEAYAPAAYSSSGPALGSFPSPSTSSSRYALYATTTTASSPPPSAPAAPAPAPATPAPAPAAPATTPAPAPTPPPATATIGRTTTQTATAGAPAGASAGVKAVTLGAGATDGSVYRAAAGYLDLSGPARLAASGAVTQLTGLIKGERKRMLVRGVLYADGGGKPGAIVATTRPVTIAAWAPASWVSLRFASAVSLAPGTYWLGYWYGHGAGSGGGGFAFTTTGAAGAFAPVPYTATPAAPAMFPSGLTSNRRYALFATVAAAATPALRTEAGLSRAATHARAKAINRLYERRLLVVMRLHRPRVS